MNDEKYIFDNKIYNITTSTKIYEYSYKENTGFTLMGGFPMYREVKKVVYRSSKGRLYETTITNGRIAIKDIADNELKRTLIKKNELNLLKELYPETLNEMEEA